MFILGILGYLVIGFVAIYATAVIHVIRAESLGYNCAEWWIDFMQEFEDDVTAIKYIIGLIIWPLRLAEFIIYIPEFYKQ